MAVGKNKRKPRKQKKKIVDSFIKKAWYTVQAPGMFPETLVCRTPVNKSYGTYNANESLKGRVFKVSLADLNYDEDRSYRKIHLIAEDVQGDQVLTNFAGMSFVSHKIKSLVRKNRSLIEAFVELNTSDGYRIRLFVVGFTKRRPNQRKATFYASSAQQKQIRKKMRDIIVRESADSDLKTLFKKLIAETVASRIELECQGIYPLTNVYIHKVKVLARPNFDRYKLLELHAEKPENFGKDTRKLDIPGGEEVAGEGDEPFGGAVADAAPFGGAPVEPIGEEFA